MSAGYHKGLSIVAAGVLLVGMCANVVSAGSVIAVEPTNPQMVQEGAFIPLSYSFATTGGESMQGVNGWIDWGDGTPAGSFTTGNGSITLWHRYLDAGDYTAHVEATVHTMYVAAYTYQLWVVSGYSYTHRHSILSPWHSHYVDTSHYEPRTGFQTYFNSYNLEDYTLVQVNGTNLAGAPTAPNPVPLPTASLGGGVLFLIMAVARRMRASRN